MTGLQRNLGLSAVFTVSLGAMIGSGIFVLPGLATKLTGPAAAFAYFLAGVIVIPAGLSQSEMATAMPRAGGAYLFIDRAMGPLMGTVAGFGVWFALVFKAAFALVGLGGYLVFFLDVPVKAVGIVLAVLLVVINALGVKETGRFQTVVVFGVLAVLMYFVVVGGTNVNASAFEPLLTHGVSGLLAATGLVFVSYAGVTNIASVAEEVKDPGRTLPRGMLSSIGLMIFLYPAMVWVIVGNVSAGGPGRRPATNRHHRRAVHGPIRCRRHLRGSRARTDLDGQRRVAVVLAVSVRHGSQPLGTLGVQKHQREDRDSHRQHRHHRHRDARTYCLRAALRVGQARVRLPGTGVHAHQCLGDRLPRVECVVVPAVVPITALSMDPDFRNHGVVALAHPARRRAHHRIGGHRRGRGGLVPRIRTVTGQP